MISLAISLYPAQNNEMSFFHVPQWVQCSFFGKIIGNPLLKKAKKATMVSEIFMRLELANMQIVEPTILNG